VHTRKGRIARKFDGDLVVLDEKLRIEHVFVRGEKVS
jgi:N-acetylglucosamine-6-phosphate deacetylase